MRISAIEASKRFVEEFFPECDAAFLAGSVVRGDQTKSSDLDIVIIDKKLVNSYRESFFKWEWPIEAFVYNPDGFWKFAEDNIKRARPSLLRMVAEGTLILGDEAYYSLKIQSQKLLDKGPEPWPLEDIDRSRYGITDYLEDLIGSTDPAETLFIVNKLSVLVHEFILRTNNQWIGEGKWVVRSLNHFDKGVSQKFVDVFSRFYKTGSKDEVVRYVDQVLDAYGGRLFSGFSLGK